MGRTLKEKKISARKSHHRNYQRPAGREKSKLTIKYASTDQLDALSEFMPDHDLTDSDAKILALRMYYLEFKLRTK